MIVNFVAPGGAGKSGIINKLLATNGMPFYRPVSYTSRRPRSGEHDGEERYFRSKEEILAMRDLIAVHETKTGIVYADQLQELSRPGICLTTFLPVGVKELEERCDRVLVILLEVTEDECRRRMILRSDPIDEVERRIERDRIEQRQLSEVVLASPVFHVDGMPPLSEVCEAVYDLIKTEAGK